jgi:tetratricopeptide (TPR) repeat protein
VGGDISGLPSRREFLTWCAASGYVWSSGLKSLSFGAAASQNDSLASSAIRPTLRLIPHYPKPSPLEDVLRCLRPGADEFHAEVYADEIEDVLAAWTEALRRSNFEALAKSFSGDFRGPSWQTVRDRPVRSGPPIEVRKRSFAGEASRGTSEFLIEWREFLGSGNRVMAAEFKLPSLKVRSEQPLRLDSSVRYDIVLANSSGAREEHVGFWRLGWVQSAGKLTVQSWGMDEETFSSAPRPLFEDITELALGEIRSFRRQLLPGTDYWRTVLDQASGIDVYGNNGIAAGDIDNDGFDEIYICQPSGLPNRLYRNLGNGTFTDATEQAGVGLLDNTPCALFADVDNDGFQDLLVITASRPLLFINSGRGTFALKPNAFEFANPPEGTFTGAAFGDYDRDGLLDVYFCLYSYYKGLDQYQYPRPYYNAVNGPPKFLFRNRGGGSFEDVTARAGLTQNNTHYGFDCTWCDFDQDGWPDLYVVNDFGAKNLYRNNRDGTFTDVAEQAGVLDIGPGMSSCWLDSAARGREDLYVSDMWEPAGLRVTDDPSFMKNQPEGIRGLYRRHAKGNSLYQNQGNGQFEDLSAAAGVERAGWSWSSDAWDFDHDGYPDLYVANGMISGPDHYDCESFFWRQVVARSPGPGGTSKRYEMGWNAINELIRSDSTWAGYQRNVLYLNNRDGTFSEVSGTAGLDFGDDSRAFALTDLDHDGRLEVFLKNRTGPQVRVLRANEGFPCAAIAIRLRGDKSNRDGIGAAVTVQTNGRRQTKILRVGTGFVSQHTKELFFGLGASPGEVHLHVLWPSGATQDFSAMPVNHRIELAEGQAEFQASPFAAAPNGSLPAPPQAVDPPSAVDTWLVDPLPAPEFDLPGLDRREVRLGGAGRHPALLYFWSMADAPCREGLFRLYRARDRWQTRRLQVVGVNVDATSSADVLGEFAREQGMRATAAFDLVSATAEVNGVYNLLFRYLYDRRRNLGLPTAFLLDGVGSIVKVYQSHIDLEKLSADVDLIPTSAEARLRLALPFPGNSLGGDFSRNYHTYGTAYFQAGYPDQALAAFQTVVRRDPSDATAQYNLGTIYLQKGEPERARAALVRALEIRPAYADALNDLGLLASRAGRSGEAESYFQKALDADPGYVIALQNLGTLYRGEKKWNEARATFEHALQLEPGNAELQFEMGIVFAMQNDVSHARSYFEQAVKLAPDYADAWNNLGVLLAKSGNSDEALNAFLECVKVAPDYVQGYLNAARVYAIEGDKAKAGALLRRWLERHPDDREATAALQQLSN